jgi:hypothetical protein
MAKKKTSKKVTKKISKKVTKRVVAKAKPVARKKVVKKASKKVSKKSAVRKKPVAKKKAAKKVVRKAAKKISKRTPSKRIRRAKKVENKLDQLQSLLQDNLSGLNTEKAEELAKSVWLAGLGAYSRTFEEFSERQDDWQEKLHNRYEKISTEGTKVFEELVVRGKELQGEAEKVIEHGRETLEDRVEDFKERFGGGLSSFIDIPSRLRDAAERIEEISDRLNKKKK